MHNLIINIHPLCILEKDHFKYLFIVELNNLLLYDILVYIF